MKFFFNYTKSVALKSLIWLNIKYNLKKINDSSKSEKVQTIQ